MNIKYLSNNSKEAVTKNRSLVKIEGVSGIIAYFLRSRRITFKEYFSVDNDFYVPYFRNENGSVHEDNDLLRKEYINMLELMKNKCLSLFYTKEYQDAKYLLPLAIKRDIEIICSEDNLLDLINSIKKDNLSEIAEIKVFGQKLMELIELHFPNLVNKINDDCEMIDEFQGIDVLYSKQKIQDGEKIDSVRLAFSSFYESIDATVRDFRICIFYLMKRYNLDYYSASENAYRFFKESSKKDFLKMIIDNGEDSILELVNYQFELPISILSVLNLPNDKIHIPNIRFTRREDFYIPNNEYEDLYNEYNRIYDYFIGLGVKKEDLVYLYLNGNIVNGFMNINAKELLNICNNISKENSSIEIRTIIEQMIDAIKIKTPIIAEYLETVLEKEKGNSLVLK